jgi:diguanylate cyclase (GGDEF)-like protein
LLLSIPSTAAPPAKTARPIPHPIITAIQAHSLSNEEANRGLPVHLHGVITFFDPDWGSGHAAIFMADATGCIFLRMDSKEAAGLFVGALVDVRGVTAPGGFGPLVFHPQVRVLGRGPLPQNPKRVSFALLKTGAEDAQWVEVEGSIHRIIEYPHSITLLLQMLDGAIYVTMVRDPGFDYNKLIDAQVRIDANAAPTTNSDDQMIGVHLQAPNLSTLKVLQPAPPNPFALDYVQVTQLLQWQHFATPLHRVHMRGTVTLYWPGSMLCIRDDTRGICAQTSQNSSIALGDQVDLAGFVETDNSSPVVTDAIFRSDGSKVPVSSRPSTAAEILKGQFNSELIQIEGRLIGYDLASSDTSLQLASGDALFPVVLPKSLAGAKGSEWKVGSKLRITGICSATVDTQNHVREGIGVTKSFRVLLRSEDDIAVIENPSWWTPAHAILVLTLALTTTLVILGWVVLLRRRIEQQAILLKESEERFRHLALHDALTGLPTRMLLNDRLEIALEHARRRNSGLAILMVDLDKFKEINDTYGHPAGDEVLRVTARRLLQRVRTDDTVARLGGDEFVVLLRDLTEKETATRIAASIVESLAAPIRFEGHVVPVSASVGLRVVSSEESDAASVMKQADIALYDSKIAGRNRFTLFKNQSPLTKTA